MAWSSVALWILGEAKSGKSELAEAMFARLPGKKFYIGTLPGTSKNMGTIKKHVDQRPKNWELIEITDSLGAATKSIGWSGKNEVIAALLDGWGVYVRCRASQWDKDNMELTTTGEAHFVDAIYSEYRRLVDVCDYLVIVAHVSAPPCRFRL
ncbi:bifunctional adenosylcobinamide kinase/adenosylcobinamide-phosphate guanylyltransferase [Candidatus Poribacteria bacterium]